MSTNIEPWGAGFGDPPTTVDPAEVELCANPECQTCMVTGAGARVMAEALGMDYDAEPIQSQAQLMHLASHVYSSMSEAILNLPGIKSLSSAAVTPAGVVTE